MTVERDVSPATHAALSLAADGAWHGDRDNLRRQLAVVEQEAAALERRKTVERVRDGYHGDKSHWFGQWLDALLDEVES